MDAEFLTKGLEKDRYLKSVKLSEEFEKKVYKTIRDVFDELVEEQKGLFTEDVSPDERNNPTRGYATLATLRIDYRLARGKISDEEERSNKALTVGLEIVDSGKQFRDMEAEGSLSYVYYKIKNDDEQNFIEVKSQTEDPEINFGEDMWNNAPGIFYIPVKDGEGFREGLKILRDHFSKFRGHFEQ